MSETKSQFQKAQKTLIRINANLKRAFYMQTRHIFFNLQKNPRRGKYLDGNQETKQNKNPYLQRRKGKNHISSFLKNHTSIKRVERFEVWREKDHQFRIPYPVKLSFNSEGEIKTFSYKQKLREFVVNRPALQEMLKILQRKGKGYR